MGSQKVSQNVGERELSWKAEDKYTSENNL